jgi:hypothetical protein
MKTKQRNTVILTLYRPSHKGLLGVHMRSSECSLAEIKTSAVQCIRYQCYHHLADRVILEKLTATPLAKKFPTFYGTPTFITMFTRTCHWPVRNQMDPVHSLTFCLLKTHFNVILPFMPTVSHVCYTSRPSYLSRIDHSVKP